LEDLNPEALNTEDEKLAKKALDNEGCVVSEDEEPPPQVKTGMFTQEEASIISREFLAEYFSEAQKVVRHEESFIKEIGDIEIKIDYLKCRRFLTTAINNLKDIDFNLIKGALQKLYKDTDSLFNFYFKFIQDNKNCTNIFEALFLKKVKPMQNMMQEISLCKSNRDGYAIRLKTSDEEIKKVESKPKTTESLAELKKLKLAHGELVHNFATARDKHDKLTIVYVEAKELLRLYFEAVFESYSKNLGNRLYKVVNYKAHCLDKLLWFEAENNHAINSFFKRANITGSYSMKTFIGFYMRRIDMNKSKDNDWHKYLQDLLKMLDG